MIEKITHEEGRGFCQKYPVIWSESDTDCDGTSFRAYLFIKGLPVHITGNTWDGECWLYSSGGEDFHGYWFGAWKKAGKPALR